MQTLVHTVTLRQFSPGEFAEVDFAGKTIEWIDSFGEIHEGQVFIGILCYSQLIFALAVPDQKKANWLHSHCKMFEAFMGVPKVVVPDNLKAGVIKSHLYDPELNPDYTDLAAHYETAIVPARVRHPKDKGLVEGAVKLVTRLFRFTYRRHTFTSIDEINRALAVIVARLNNQPHSRFAVSRQSRFDTEEKAALKPLPLQAWGDQQWKICILHPDCTVGVERNFYSAPFHLRGKELRVKITANQIEIFDDLKRLALHQRVPAGKVGVRVLDPLHLPLNSRAYLETTPQNLLSQSKFIHPKLHELVQLLFEKDVLGHLRRAQGLIGKAHTLVQCHGHSQAGPWIETAVTAMTRFNRIRVTEFERIIREEQKKKISSEDRNIVRIPGNPMLRRVDSSTGSITHPHRK